MKILICAGHTTKGKGTGATGISSDSLNIAEILQK